VSDAILEQAEIDRLVEAVRSGRVPTGPRSLVRLRDVRKIDIRDPSFGQDRIVRRRLPVLDLVFDRLAPALQITLTKSLRFPVRVENGGVELRKFGDFRTAFSDKPAVYVVMRLDPLRGTSMFVFDPYITYALIDALLGGLGVADMPNGREMSDIEIGLLVRVHNDVMRDLENAWRPWFPLRVEALRNDRPSGFMSSLPDSEVCHVGKMLVTGDVLPQLPLYFVLPYASLEPLHEAISARAGEEIDPNWRQNLDQNVRETPVEVRAVLGDATLPASRLRALRPGDVIEFPVRVDEDVTVEVEGQEIFRGRFGRSRDKYGVRIGTRRTIEVQLVDRTAGQVLVRKGLISREQLAVAQVDELLNRRSLFDSIAARGWCERRVLEQAVMR
jgi:flagellar motor switch protein FliM